MWLIFVKYKLNVEMIELFAKTVNINVLTDDLLIIY